MEQFGIGQPVRRKEDVRFVTGAGRYTDDIDIAGQAHAVVLRSPHAHARIRAIDTRAAEAAPGGGSWAATRPSPLISGTAPASMARAKASRAGSP